MKKKNKGLNRQKIKNRSSMFLLGLSLLLAIAFVNPVVADADDVAAGKQSVESIRAAFPYRQVENNVAVEFFIKPLPSDEIGFEKEINKLKRLFSNREDQSETSESLAALDGELEKLKVDERFVKAGQDLALIFKVSDATMGWQIQGQGFVPDSPIRAVAGKGNFEYSRRQVLKRAKLYGGHFPIDEYTYLFVLNSVEGSISVMDTSSLYSGTPIDMIRLSKDRDVNGIDIDMEWLGRYAYVTLDNDEVAVIDCMRLKLIRNIKVGKNPHHVLVQPDGKFAWICNDGDATVTVIDTENQKIVSTLNIGKGHHEIAFTSDSRYACITNQDDGTLSLIDVFKLQVTGTVEVGKRPHGLGYSELSRYMYVANEGEATVSVVDIDSKREIKKIPVGNGCVKVRFAVNPRYGFIPNKKDDTCTMIDVTRDVVHKTIETGKGPEDVSFSPDWVFIRNTGSADLTAMCLNQYAMLTTVPIGYKKPIESDLPLGHVTIVPQGDGHSVLVPSPAGGAVYRYAPGEAAAGGRVPTEVYNTQAKGSSKLVVYYRGLKEISNGVYLRVVRFQGEGRYEMGFYIDNPELSSCFDVNVYN